MLSDPPRGNHRSPSLTPSGFQRPEVQGADSEASALSARGGGPHKGRRATDGTIDAREGDFPFPLEIFVAGLPQTQGSMKSLGRGRMVHDKGFDLTRWRQNVTKLASAVWGDRPPYADPVRLDLEFYLGGGGSRGYPLRFPAIELQGGAVLYVAAQYGRDDLDKLLRAVMDAITKAKLWRDDSLVVEAGLAKFYAAPPALPPGVKITIAPFPLL